MRYEWDRIILSCVVLGMASFVIETHIVAAQGSWDSYMNRGKNAYKQGDDFQAETQFSFAVQEAQRFDLQDVRVGQALYELGNLYSVQRKHVDAETHLKKALSILEKNLKSSDQQIGSAHLALARLYRSQNKNAESESHYRQAFAIFDEMLGAGDPLVKEVALELIDFLDQVGKDADAREIKEDISKKARDDNRTARGASEETYDAIEVFYATDRSKTGLTDPLMFYGTGRGNLEYGTCLVAIPKSHRRSELESPKMWKFEFRENPQKHVSVLNVTPLTIDQLKKGLSSANSRDILVFIHGFNVSFKDAVRRTAQLAYDLHGTGVVPFAYSWPSHAWPLGYIADETNVQWTEPHLKQALLDLKLANPDARIHLLAHSMGNRALTNVLKSLAVDPNLPIFNQVVLASPDIDRDTFERDIAPNILRTAKRFTLYASSKDRALQLSFRANSYPRVGQSGNGLVLVPGLDTVDASAFDTSMLGLEHSFFAERPELIYDLLMLLRDFPPIDRGLISRQLRGNHYWSFAR